MHAHTIDAHIHVCEYAQILVGIYMYTIIYEHACTNIHAHTHLFQQFEKRCSTFNYSCTKDHPSWTAFLLTLSASLIVGIGCLHTKVKELTSVSAHLPMHWDALRNLKSTDAGALAYRLIFNCSGMGFKHQDI